MAQFVPGTRIMVWNDRDDGKLIARLRDLDTGRKAVLARSVYALSPDGRTALSLNMDRLEKLRPGYGYAGGIEESEPRLPHDDGVWRMDLDGSAPQLILPLGRAVAFLTSRLPLAERVTHLASRPMYWFNHAKISPDGQRFTIKLRWRPRDMRKSCLLYTSDAADE